MTGTRTPASKGTSADLCCQLYACSRRRFGSVGSLYPSRGRASSSTRPRLLPRGLRSGRSGFLRRRMWRIRSRRNARRSSAASSRSMTGIGRSGRGLTMAQAGKRGTSEDEGAISAEAEGGGEEGAGAEEIMGGVAGNKSAPEHQLQRLHHPRTDKQRLSNRPRTKSRPLALTLARIRTLMALPR